MNFISKLFGKKPEPELDLEKAVGKYLLNLPRCHKNIVIVSPEYDKTHHTCEIIMSAETLLPWAEQHADAVWSTDQEVQAARNALPIWLRGFDTSTNTTSYVPHFIYKVLEPYILKFVNDGTAKIFCLECQSYITDVHMDKLDEKNIGGYSQWKDVWKCPQGHMLYQEEHEMHISTRR